jgi:hypothetical protein
MSTHCHHLKKLNQLHEYNRQNLSLVRFEKQLKKETLLNTDCYGGTSMRENHIRFLHRRVHNIKRNLYLE